MPLREEPGSISHGTLRLEDLVPAFLEKYRQLDPTRALIFATANAPELAALGKHPNSADDDQWLYEELFRNLEQLAPPDYYFGTHPGDDSDFGFWPLDPNHEGQPA